METPLDFLGLQGHDYHLKQEGEDHDRSIKRL